jgi:hypothetical protein
MIGRKIREEISSDTAEINRTIRGLTAVMSVIALALLFIAGRMSHNAR